MNGENGVPETPDWHNPPRCWPEHGSRCETCDVCNRREHDGYGVYPPIPDNIVLGAE